MKAAISIVFLLCSLHVDVLAREALPPSVADFQAQMPVTFSKQEILARWKVYTSLAIEHRDRPIFDKDDSVKTVTILFDGLTITYIFSKETKIKQWDGLADGLFKIIYEDRDMWIEETHIYSGPIWIGGLIVWDGPSSFLFTGLRKKKG